ncbi:hypothetical protein [Pseudodesulfovibrio sp.]|uniref:hypothetical protein n=1 Tax=Pseudodesulfovibrio sp. TaxID=2035812 RepID=UPI00260FF8C6|nr:hypothetical protein [Pseudodesulfovibrio sp.]MDD3310944.1 hypothetical protein [Pseudodesulfovibrio sp.]
MRYRKWAADGTDMQMGHGNADYWQDDARGVAQAVVSRLRLLREEWFLDLAEGTPYVGGVFGKHTRESYDLVIRARILGTEGVTEIASYESSYDGDTRGLTITASINTKYGEIDIQEVL